MLNEKIAVIYEIPHLIQIQGKLREMKAEFERMGYRVVMQNPAPYTSNQIVKKAKICFLIEEPYTTHGNKIAEDYEKAGALVGVVSPKRLNELVSAIHKKAEQKVEEDNAFEASLFDLPKEKKEKKAEEESKEKTSEEK